MRADKHNRAPHPCRHASEVCLHLVGRRSKTLRTASSTGHGLDDRAQRRNKMDGRSRHGAPRGRRPGEHFEHEVVFHGRDDVPARLLVEPTLAHGLLVRHDREVPRLEAAVSHPPALHLLDRPAGGVLMVGRPGQPGPMHIGQVVHGLHDLRVAHALASDAGIHDRVDRLGRLLGRDDGHKADSDEQREPVTQHEGLLEGVPGNHRSGEADPAGADDT